MGRRELYAVCIERAATLVGGYEALAARLKVPAAVLERWAHGDGLGTRWVFLKAIDILLEAERQPPIPTRSSPEASTKYRT